MNWFEDLLAFAGAAVLFAGLWLIYPPAALIVLGLLLVVFAAGVQAERKRNAS